MRRILQLLTVTASVAFACVIGEFLVRYRHEAWPFEQKMRALPYLSPRDANLKWRFPTEAGRNSLGLRNKEVGPKENNQFRILFIGDSLVWSGETSSGYLFTRVVEQNLNYGPGAAGKQFEIVNAGVPGYTTYQEVEFLKTYGLDMQPDLVIVGFVFNDVYYKYLHRPSEKDILAMEPTARLHRFDTRSLPGSLFARSYLAHELFHGSRNLSKKLTGAPYFPFNDRDDFYLAWEEYGWHRTNELLGELQGILKAKGIPLAVVIFPMRDQAEERYLTVDRDYVLSPQRHIKSICDNYRIPYLDLTDSINRNGGDKLFRDHIHFNRKGSDVAAAEITQYLLANSAILATGN